MVPRRYPGRWWSTQHSGSCHPVWKTSEILCYEKSVKMPILTTGGKMAPFSIWSSPSQRGRTCVPFQHNRADGKIAYEKKDKWLQSLFWVGLQAHDIWSLWRIIFEFLSSFLGESDWYMGLLNISLDALLWYEAFLGIKFLLFCAVI